MIQPPEIVEIDADHVACDGGGGPLGHPRVFLTVGEAGEVECPYCDRKFVRAAPRSPAAAPETNLHAETKSAP